VPDTLLQITSLAALYKFTKDYGQARVYPGFVDRSNINWSAVADRYSGIEISPYQWEARDGSETSWYYGWDVASGCIWDPAIITPTNDPMARFLGDDQWEIL